MREKETKAQVKKRHTEIRQKDRRGNKSYRTAWAHTWIPAVREVDLEPSANREANRIKALMSIY